MTFLELEKACKRRRVLRILKILFFLLLISAVCSGIWFYNSGNVKNNKQTSEIKTSKKEFNKTNRVKKLETEKANKIEKTVRREEKNVRTLQLLLDLNLSVPKEEKIIKNKTPRKEVKKVNTRVQKETKNVSENTRISKENILKAKTLPSYDTCISLSEFYLKNGDYKEALKWAKNANVQNKKRPESWIMSAKALYAAGKKDEAVNILKIYLNYVHDKQAENLLKRYENE